MMNFFIRVKRGLLELLYPREAHCALCGDESDSATVGLCKRCEPFLRNQYLSRGDIEGIAKLYAAYHYEEPIRGLIHRYKYHNQRYLARFFAHILVKLLEKERLGEAALIAVPLHPNKQKKRGFSQTSELCYELANLTKLPVLRNALVRTRDTPSQTTLMLAERQYNLHGAFTADENVAGKRIILIDDVSTTGSTLKECAIALKKKGAREIYALVIAT